MFFRNIVLCSFVAAFFASLAYGFYQQTMVTPIILQAELFEIPEAESGPEPWSPEDGLERSLFTFSADFLTAFAYALILLSLMASRPQITVLQGIAWGLAGYLVFFAVPALGLPPEIPGMQAADLVARQIWWLVTVIFTAGGLWILAFSKMPLRLVSVLLFIAPFLIGAPQPEKHGFANPEPMAVEKLEALWHQFILQSCIANALLWLIIGVISAWLTAKYIMPLNEQQHS